MEKSTASSKGLNLCQRVRTSCDRVMSRAEHVKIDEGKLKDFADTIVKKNWKPEQWDENDFHRANEKDDLEQKLGYIFVMDTLNFCFWPSNSWEYCDLARALGNLAEKDFFNPSNLIKTTVTDIKKEVFGGNDFPLLEERHRLLHEHASQTIEHFEGKYENIILKCNKSAVKLIEILTGTFPNFQDHAIYKGELIHLLKRVQILVGDIWGAFHGKGIGEFNDIHELTMFPDYRVPQLLRHEGVFSYSKELAELIDNKKEIPHGGAFEVEIRAATVVAVEKLKELLDKLNHPLTSVEIDWLLWQKGEEIKDTIAPHHRTLSIFY